MRASWRGSGRRRVLPPGGIVRVLLVGAAGAGLVLAADRLPDSVALEASQAPTTASQAPTTAAGPATRAELVCPGGELTGAEGVKDVTLTGTVTAAVPPASLVRDLAGGLPHGAGRIAIGALGAKPGVSSSRRAPVTVVDTSGDALDVRARGPLAPGLVAAQEWVSDTSTVRGLGSAPCTTAVRQAWFAAGGGKPGRQERLVLTNPGAHAVTVDVEMLGAEGRVDSAAAQDVVVPAGTRHTVLLDAISGTEARPVVQVTANGGVVQATVNDIWLDGTTPSGADDASSLQAPSREQVIPAVAGDGATVRVAVPGSREAVVQVRLVTAKGRTALGKGGVVRVAGGAVADVALGRLPRGVIGVEVSGDQPVVAGAQMHSGPRAGGDFAWAASTGPVTELAGAVFARPKGAGAVPTRTLSLVATGGAVTAEVVTVDGAGEARTTRMKLAADTSSGIDVSGATSVWVHRAGGAGELRGGVVSTLGSGDQQLVTARPLVAPQVRAHQAQVVQYPAG